MGSGCGHEIVRALETRPKAVLWKIEFEFCVVMGLKVYCKDISIS